MKKTFKGLLADGQQQKIRLSTNNGEMGYRVVKFQGIGNNPGGQNPESLLTLTRYKQSTIDGTINFDNPSILGIVYWQGGATAGDTPQDMTIIFDDKIVNQDIFISHHEAHGNQSCNYYVELEQVKLSKDEAAISTLVDMRGRE